jgi:hypothetical protein
MGHFLKVLAPLYGWGFITSFRFGCCPLGTIQLNFRTKRSEREAENYSRLLSLQIELLLLLTLKKSIHTVVASLKRALIHQNRLCELVYAARYCTLRKIIEVNARLRKSWPKNFSATA